MYLQFLSAYGSAWLFHWLFYKNCPQFVSNPPRRSGPARNPPSIRITSQQQLESSSEIPLWAIYGRMVKLTPDTKAAGTVLNGPTRVSEFEHGKEVHPSDELWVTPAPTEQSLGISPNKLSTYIERSELTPCFYFMYSLPDPRPQKPSIGSIVVLISISGLWAIALLQLDIAYQHPIGTARAHYYYMC